LRGLWWRQVRRLQCGGVRRCSDKRRTRLMLEGRRQCSSSDFSRPRDLCR
jgi:hypothetical protein